MPAIKNPTNPTRAAVLAVQAKASQSTPKLETTVTGQAADTTDGTDGIALFQNSNYRTRDRTGIRVNKMAPKAAVLDARTGPDLINNHSVPPASSNPIKPVNDLGLTSATRQFVDIEVALLLHFFGGDLRVGVWPGGVRRLAVHFLLVTSFIDRFITAIFPREVRIVPDNSRPGAILWALQTAVKVIKDAICPVSEPIEPVLLRATKWNRIPPFSVGFVTVEGRGSGLMFVVAHAIMSRRRSIMATRGSGRQYLNQRSTSSSERSQQQLWRYRRECWRHKTQGCRGK